MNGISGSDLQGFNVMSSSKKIHDRLDQSYRSTSNIDNGGVSPQKLRSYSTLGHAAANNILGGAADRHNTSLSHYPIIESNFENVGGVRNNRSHTNSMMENYPKIKADDIVGAASPR